MGLFGKIFKKENSAKKKRGFVTATVSKIEKLTSDTVKISFDFSAEDKPKMNYRAGQYVNVSVELNGKEERRSYSICSFGENEKLSIGVKQVENGKVSSYLNNELKEGDKIWVGTPEGNFVLNNNKNIVCFAAGSGITPIMAFAKRLEAQNGKLNLFYGSKSENQIIFNTDLTALNNTTVNHFLSKETKEGYNSGRLNKETITEALKANLELLKADGFYFCGPEEMIFNGVEVLKTLGVNKDKIHYELFTTPTLFKAEDKAVVSNFNGKAKVTVILDDEETQFELAAKGDTILVELESEGIDAPFSCKGGVCSTCKAKIVSGKASMDVNYTLTDEEIEQGYVLTCQAHPQSEELTITYDD